MRGRDKQHASLSHRNSTIRLFVLLFILVLIIIAFFWKRTESKKDHTSDNTDAYTLDLLYKSVKIVSDIKNTIRPAWYDFDMPSDLSWADINEDDLNKLNGLNYWEPLPELDFGQCTGYVSWAVLNYYNIPDYPHDFSTEDNRNAGEYVDSHRMWLQENAYYVGSATTDTGEIVYTGGRYLPGDIIVFNITYDCSEGFLYSAEYFDYWADELYGGNFTHIAIVGTDNTNWKEDLTLDSPIAIKDGTLPEGQYNMHHSIESHGGVCNILSPEQFITRAATNTDIDDDFSHSYEIYRVLKP